MKSFLKTFMGTGLLVLAGFGPGLWAGSIDYLSNQSADYVRTFSRNAAIDTDAAVYNPAGTAFMKPGLHLTLSNQSVFKTYTDTLAMGNAYDKDYKSIEPTWLLPNGAVVYNSGNWAAFLSAGVMGGGGTLNYSDGIPMMVFQSSKLSSYFTSNYSLPANNTVWTGGNLTATSLFPQVTLGGAYAFNSQWSLSLGIRGVYAYKSYKGSASYYTSAIPKTTVLNADASETALGVGGIVGLDFRPFSELLFALRFETPTMLNFKTTVNGGNNFGGLFVDGNTHRKDMPAMVGLGASWTWDRLTLTSSFDGFFTGLAGTYSHANSGSIYVDGYDDSYDPFGFEISGSFEYEIIPQFFSLSAGYMYDKVGGNSKTYNDFDYSLDSNTIGGGAKLMATPDLAFSLGVSHTFYISSKGDGAYSYVTYKKDTTIVALSADYKLF